MAAKNKAIAYSDPVRTPKGRFMYLHCFEPDPVQECYAGTLAVDADAYGLEDFKKAVLDFAREAYGDDMPKGLHWPVKSGKQWLDAKSSPPADAIAEYVKDRMIITFKTQKAPAVSIPKNGRMAPVSDDLDKQAVFPGAFGATKGTMAAYRGQYPSIVFYFDQVAQLGTGDRLAGASRNPEESFGDMWEAEKKANGADELDDDIPW